VAFPVVAVQLPTCTASLPDSVGKQFFPQKYIDTHETMHIHIISQKKVKYSTKSATRIFCEDGAKFRNGLHGPNASRFSSRLNVKLCMDVEEDYWNVLMWSVFLKHALAVRKLRNTPEFLN